ncbi:GGDEF domain-containing protein [Lentibacillus saliphilus]|uniref:GGDEF domain-containing protein n=1 Tax=Lentibacillus saliphilus TaxID=2737028 RepID=UPI001C30636B|nr:diguanylate cyclase [Lentibacillus saliphilus]
MILKDLFANLTILIAMLFLYTQFINTKPLSRESSYPVKIIAGILGGLLSNILMQYSMQIDTTIIDLRHIPVILLSYYGGPIPALITMTFVIAGRLFIGINMSSLFAIISITSITAFSIIMMMQKLRKKIKIVAIMTFANIIITILFINLSMDPQQLVIILPVYWSVSYAAGFIAFYVSEFLLKSHRLLNKYKQEAEIDGLTGLNNHRSFDQAFNRIIKKRAEKKDISLLYIDIDFFKRINDTYGHSEGDLILKQLSQILQKTVRSSDIVSRKGGEEFTIILNDCPLPNAEFIGELIRKTVELNNFELASGTQIKLTVSVGIATFPETTTDPIKLIEDADHALYEAKQTGRNKVCISGQFKLLETI